MALFSGQKNTTTQVGEKEAWHAPLNKPTSVSKITAAVVVIILPFLGFFLGVQYVSGVAIGF